LLKILVYAAPFCYELLLGCKNVNMMRHMDYVDISINPQPVQTPLCPNDEFSDD